MTRPESFAAATNDGPGMAPPRETPRERRLQQQRDALSHAISLAQETSCEEALRTELLRAELFMAEGALEQAQSVLLGGSAERRVLKGQLDAMAAELGATRADHARAVSSSKLPTRHSNPSSRVRSSSPLQRPSSASGGGGGAGGLPRRGMHSATPPATAPKRNVQSSSTQTLTAERADAADLEALARAQSAELSGLRAQVEALQEQSSSSVQRKRQEFDGKEQAYVAAVAAHGTSALHARLLWAEAHSLEGQVAGLSAQLTLERTEHVKQLHDKETALHEAIGQLTAERREHEQELGRARADRRVSARNAKDFLEGKHAVEKQRTSLETQVSELEEQRAALAKEQKEKVRLLKTHEVSSQEKGSRISQLEKSLAESRRALKRQEEGYDKASAQSRSDREVLAECVRQMANQLAAARAATEGTHAKLIGLQDESSQHLKAAEEVAEQAQREASALQAQLSECERQLQMEVDASQVRHGAEENAECTSLGYMGWGLAFLSVRPGGGRGSHMMLIQI